MPHTIRSWTYGLTLDWFDLITTRGVYVEKDCERNNEDFIVDTFYGEDHTMETHTDYHPTEPYNPQDHGRSIRKSAQSKEA